HPARSRRRPRLYANRGIRAVPPLTWVGLWNYGTSFTCMEPTPATLRKPARSRGAWWRRTAWAGSVTRWAGRPGPCRSGPSVGGDGSRCRRAWRHGWCRRGLRGLHDRLLRRHQDPEQRVDQDLAARDDEQDQHEQQPGGPGVDAEAAAEAGDDAAQHTTVSRSHQALVGETGVDLVHGVPSFCG